jgi:hypothetical protein
MEYDMEKNLLRNVNRFRLFFIQFLIMGLFANSLLPQACFCGEACLHGLQDTANDRQRIPFHNRCSGTQCTSCNVEDGQTIKLSKAAHSTVKLKTLNAPLILSNFSDHQFNINLITILFSRLYKYTKVQFSAIYLQNLSLLL